MRNFTTLLFASLLVGTAIADDVDRKLEAMSQTIADVENSLQLAQRNHETQTSGRFESVRNSLASLSRQLEELNQASPSSRDDTRTKIAEISQRVARLESASGVLSHHAVATGKTPMILLGKAEFGNDRSVRIKNERLSDRLYRIAFRLRGEEKLEVRDFRLTINGREFRLSECAKGKMEDSFTLAGGITSVISLKEPADVQSVYFSSDEWTADAPPIIEVYGITSPNTHSRLLFRYAPEKKNVAASTYLKNPSPLIPITRVRISHSPSGLPGLAGFSVWGLPDSDSFTMHQILFADMKDVCLGAGDFSLDYAIPGALWSNVDMAAMDGLVIEGFSDAEDLVAQP